MNMYALIVVVIAAVATYALRASTVAFFARRALPDSFERSLRYVAPALLAALVASSLASGLGNMAAAEVLPRAVALAAGLAATVRTRKPAAAMAVGLPVMWIASALVAGLGAAT